MFQCSEDEEAPEAFLSIEELDFGEIKSQESVSRIFILYNNSKSSNAKFQFEKPKFIYKDQFSISPQEGELNKGEQVEVRLTITGSLNPTIYEGELECKIYWVDIEKKNVSMDDKKLSKQTTIQNKLDSRIQSPNTSIDKVDRDKTRNMDKKKVFVSQTLYLRIKKKSKIDVEEQRELLRLSKVKEITLQDDSIFTAVFSRLIDDVLTTHKLEKITNDVLSQQPRLFCFFDMVDPVKVDDMNARSQIDTSAIREEREEESIEEVDQRESIRDKDQRESFKGDGMRESYRGDAGRESYKADTQIIDLKPSPIEEENQYKEISLAKQNQADNSLQPSPNLTLKSNRDFSTNIRKSQIKTIPEHLTPQDILGESMHHPHMEKQGTENLMDSVEPTTPKSDTQQISKIILRDEFKQASQLLLENTFFQLIKESVAGELNLSEVDTRRDYKRGQTRSNMQRLKTTVSGNNNQGMSSSQVKL